MERPSPANASLGATDGVSAPPLDDDAFDSAGRGGRVGSLGTLDGAPLKESANPFDWSVALELPFVCPGMRHASSFLGGSSNVIPSRFFPGPLLLTLAAVADGCPVGRGEVAGGRPRRMGATASRTVSRAACALVALVLSARDCTPDVGAADLGR
jgi:hypothetical protein